MHSITGRCTGLGADTQAGKNCRFTRSPVTAVWHVNEYKPGHAARAEVLHNGAMDLLLWYRAARIGGIFCVTCVTCVTIFWFQ